MVVYPGGQARGDSPPPAATGAAGKPAKSENRIKEDSKGCPFDCFPDMPMPGRDRGMSLEVLQPSDCPKGPPTFERDYMSSLITEDLYRAQPVLAHPTSGGNTAIPFKFLSKPPLGEVPNSRAKTKYPTVQEGRPRDLSLTTSDIEGCRPRGTGGNCEGVHRADKVVDPIDPRYKLLGNTQDGPLSARASGRCTLNVSDIEGTSSMAAVPIRKQYGDTLKCEAEFKSRKHAVALADARARAFGLATPRSETDEVAPPRDRDDALSNRLEGPKRSNRMTDPLDPRYRVPLAKDAPGTSLCYPWAEEQRYVGATSMPVESAEIGHIPGSMPKALRGNNEPTFSLETRDVVGANSQRRIGAMPHSIYGPYGNRRDWNSALDTRDITGAQADTLLRYPRVPSLNSARGPADVEDEGDTRMSARGRILQSCPEKL